MPRDFEIAHATVGRRRALGNSRRLKIRNARLLYPLICGKKMPLDQVTKPPILRILLLSVRLKFDKYFDLAGIWIFAERRIKQLTLRDSLPTKVQA